MIYLGSKSMGEVYLGSKSISEGYLGSKLVFQKGGGGPYFNPSTTESGTIDNPFVWLKELANKNNSCHTKNKSTSNLTDYRAYYYIYLEAGTTYTIGLSTDSDGCIKLYNASNAEVASNDDDSTTIDGYGVTDYFTYTPSASGWFKVCFGRYNFNGGISGTLHCYPAPGTGEPTTMYVYGSYATSNNLNGEYVKQQNLHNGFPAYYNSTNGKYLFAIKYSDTYTWVIGSSLVANSDSPPAFAYNPYSNSGSADDFPYLPSWASSWWQYGDEYTSTQFRVTSEPEEIPGPNTVYVYGTQASSHGFNGTYTKQAAAINDRPVYYCSANGKYLFAVEDGNDPGKYAWVFGSSTEQSMGGMLVMSYTVYSSLGSTCPTSPVGVTFYHEYMTAMTTSEFVVSTTAQETPQISGTPPQTVYVYGSIPVSEGMDGTYEKQNTMVNNRYVYYCSARSKYLFAVEDSMDPGTYCWVIDSSTTSSCSDAMSCYAVATANSSSLTHDPTAHSYYNYASSTTASQITVSTTAPTQEGPATLYVTGTEATSQGYAGTYTRQNNAINSHSVYYCSGTGKYLFVVQDGTNTSNYAWVFSNSTSQTSSGMIGMSYTIYAYPGTSMAANPSGLTYYKQGEGSMSSSQFTVTDTDPNGGGSGSGTSYIATGCSNSSVNGTYTDTGSTYGGYPIYGNGNGYYILRSGSTWEIWNDMESHGMPDWYHDTIVGTWNANSGGTPPTISENGGGTPTPSFTQTLYVSGSDAVTLRMDGTYVLQNNTQNDRPVYYCSARNMYMYAVEDESDPGKYAWAISPTATSSVGMIGMAYYSYAVTGTSGALATEPTGLTFYKESVTSMSQSTFAVTDTDPGSGGSGSGSGGTSYVATGGAESSVNGTYTDTGTTYNGQPVYSNGTFYLWYDGAYWCLNTSSQGGAGSMPSYTHSGTIEGTYDVAMGGTSPCPTLSASGSGSGGGENQGSGTTYIASGCSVSSFNGTYTDTGQVSNGQPIYSNGSCYLVYESNNWYAKSSIDAPMPDYWHNTITGTWDVAAGSGTPPTITEGSGGGGDTPSIPGPDTVYITGTQASTSSVDGTYVKQSTANNGKAVYYCSARNKYLFAVESSSGSGTYAWVVANSVEATCGGMVAMSYSFYTNNASNLADSPAGLTYYWSGYTQLSSSEFDVSTTSGGGGGGNTPSPSSGGDPDPVYIYGSEADSRSMTGTYTKQSSTNNNKPVYYSSGTQKYIFCVQDLSSNNYAWVVGDSVQTSDMSVTSTYALHSPVSATPSDNPTDNVYYNGNTEKTFEEFEIVADGEIVYPERVYVDGLDSSYNGVYTPTNDVTYNTSIPVYTNGTKYLVGDSNGNWYVCDNASSVINSGSFSNLTPSSSSYRSTSIGDDPTCAAWTSGVYVSLLPFTVDNNKIAVTMIGNWKGCNIETLKLTNGNSNAIGIQRSARYQPVSIINEISGCISYKGSFVKDVTSYSFVNVPSGTYTLITSNAVAGSIQGSSGSVQVLEYSSVADRWENISNTLTYVGVNNGLRSYTFTPTGGKKYVIIDNDYWPWWRWWYRLLANLPRAYVTIYNGGSWLRFKNTVEYPLGTQGGVRWYWAHIKGMFSIEVYVQYNSSVTTTIEGMPESVANRIESGGGYPSFYAGEGYVKVDNDSSGQVSDSDELLFQLDGEGGGDGTWDMVANESYRIETFPLCLVEGTSVKLANGTYKDISDITYNDELLVWNFDEGKYDVAKPLWIKRDQKTSCFIETIFDDGTILRSTGNPYLGHRVFSLNKNRFEYVTKCLGDDVVTANGVKRLVSNEVVRDKCVNLYNVITDKHFNLYADDVLTSCSLNNLYGFKDMKFVKSENDAQTNLEGIPEEYIEGLRLREQPGDWTVYVHRLLQTAKERDNE